MINRDFMRTEDRQLLNKWYLFHRPRVNNTVYETKFANKYAPFFNLISQAILLETINTPKLVEYGSGIGTCAKILLNQIPDARLTLFERSKEITDLAIENLGQLRREVRLESVNLLSLQFHNHCMNVNMQTVMQGKRPQLVPAGHVIAYSHGFLEHFDDVAIKALVTCQLSHADLAINYVPSYKYKTPSFGDERLLKPSDWYDMFQKGVKPKIIEFNDGYDIILVWRREF